MSHLIRTTSPLAAEEAATTWFVRNENGDETGPFDIATVRLMLSAREIGASTEVSRDEKSTWAAAYTFPELEMVWTMMLPTGEWSELCTAGALESMRASGAIPAGASFFRKQSTLNESAQGQKLVQQAAAATAQLRKAESEISKLKASLEAKDFEFEAERQQLSAEISKLKAEGLRRDAELESATGSARELGDQLASLQDFEAKVVDSERECGEARQALADASEKFEAEKAALNKSIADQKQLLDANADTIDSLSADKASLEKKAEGLASEKSELEKKSEELSESLKKAMDDIAASKAATESLARKIMAAFAALKDAVGDIAEAADEANEADSTGSAGDGDSPDAPKAGVVRRVEPSKKVSGKAGFRQADAKSGRSGAGTKTEKLRAVGAIEPEVIPPGKAAEIDAESAHGANKALRAVEAQVQREVARLRGAASSGGKPFWKR